MGRKIITVDDAPTMRKMICLTLRGAGHDVLEASDGSEALSVLAGRSVDLVITDLNMPRMNGIELTRQLRQKAEFRTTPILILTTESESSKKTEAKSAGATGWIVKPFTPDQLLGAIARVLH